MDVRIGKIKINGSDTERDELRQHNITNPSVTKLIERVLNRNDLHWK